MSTRTIVNREAGASDLILLLTPCESNRPIHGPDLCGGEAAIDELLLPRTVLLELGLVLAQPAAAHGSEAKAAAGIGRQAEHLRECIHAPPQSPDARELSERQCEYHQ